MSTLIVDADIVAYKLSSVSEKPIRWDNDVWTLHSDENECIVMIKDYFDNLKEQTQCTKIHHFNQQMVRSKIINARQGVYTKHNKCF